METIELQEHTGVIPAMTDIINEKKEIELIAAEFWASVEKEAEELEVTVDYYMEEFFTS